MLRQVGLALAILFCLATNAEAELSITMGRSDYPLGTGLVTIPIYVAGNDLVTSVDINIEIASPLFPAAYGNFPGSGPGESGGWSPTIGFVGESGGDIAGNFMSTTTHLFGDADSDSWNINVFENLANPFAPIPASRNGGLLLDLLVDFTGDRDYFLPGWLIILGPTNGNGSTVFHNVNTLVPVTIRDGSVSNPNTPEPASIVLGSLALVALGLVSLRKRRARRAGR